MSSYFGKRSSRMATRKARGLAIGATLAAGLLVTGASVGTASAHGSKQAAAQHQNKHQQFNAQDVSFLTMMIPHHRQALEMATMAQEKATDSKVRRLAESITRSQSREIDYMTGLLQAWGQPVPDPMDGMGHSMPGMMTDEQMAELDAMSGMEFDHMWLMMMVEHHQGALAMASMELSDGQNTKARHLAARIQRAQQREITYMNSLMDM